MENRETVHTSNGNQATNFAALLDEYTYERPKRGEILEGTILRITHDALFVDVGAKRDAIVPHTELDDMDAELLAEIAPGDEVPVYVTRTPSGDEELVVSLEKGLQKEDWDRAVKMQEDEEIRTCRVIGYNKGGLLVRFGRLEGFVPNSHVPALRRVRDQHERQAYKARQVGEELSVKVIDVEQQRQRLVLSAREAKKERRREQLEALQQGSVVTGTVTNLVKFGAFVNLGFVDGLIHISKLAHEHVEHPSQVLQPGEEVTVLVEDVDVDRERVSLNRQALIPSPWDRLPQEHQVGDLVEGEIENVVDFGVFLRLESGVVGLAHISELDLPSGIRPEDRFREGDVLLARITEMDPADERLSLSLRRVSMREELNWMSDRRSTEDTQGAVLDPAPEVEEAFLDDAREEAAEALES